MKSLLPTTMLLLLSKFALADATLVFIIPAGPNLDREVNYKLKGQILRIDQPDTLQYKLYDHSRQELVHMDVKSGNISRINQDVLSNRVMNLNQQRQQKLAEVEQKLKQTLETKSEQEKEIGETLINQLKYPEFYGAHTFLSVKKTKQTRTINAIECKVYQISRNEKLLKELCLADQKALKLSDKEYTTLRGFYHFNYSMQTQLRIAAGKTDFVQIDYEKENIPGIPIEVLTISGNNKTPEIFLKRINHDSLEPKQFIVKTQ